MPKRQSTTFLRLPAHFGISFNQIYLKYQVMFGIASKSY